MKNYHFAIPDYYRDFLFSAVRDKVDCLGVLMHAIKLMLISEGQRPSEHQENAGLTLHIDKMSRVFVWSEKKYYSIAFPFKARESSTHGIEFLSFNDVVVDSRVTSFVLMLIKTGKLFSQDEYEFLQVMEDCRLIDNGLWELLKDLITHEDGYIRYDHDVERSNGDIHPEDHLDLFYSQSVTWKIGHRGRFTTAAFVDLLDIKKQCRFISA